MADPKRPHRFKVYDIADNANTAKEAVKLLASAFPEADAEYLADLFQQREDVLAKKAERADLEARASRAARAFLTESGHANLAEACEYMGLAHQELWDQIMQENGVPQHDMPATIETGRID